VGIIEAGQILAVGSVAQIQKQAPKQRSAVKMRVLPGSGNIGEWLSARGDVSDTKVDGENVSFTHDGDENSEADLLRELISAGFRISAFGGHQQSLEDVFLQVTAGIVQ